MPRLVKVTLKERDELKPILVKDPESIEEGLKVLAHQFPTESGPLDILAVDVDGAVVVVELKDDVEDGQLDQGLRYYDWVRSNLPALSKAYPSIDPKEEPRLILIAPSFSDDLKRICTTLSANELLELKEYHAIKVPNEEIGVLTTDLESRKQFFVLHIQKPDGSWSALTRIMTKDEWNKQSQHIAESCKHISESRTT